MKKPVVGTVVKKLAEIAQAAAEAIALRPQGDPWLRDERLARVRPRGRHEARNPANPWPVDAIDGRRRGWLRSPYRGRWLD
jgi:hypothetical protein